MRESNSRQRFWRPLSYHLTNPLYSILLYIIAEMDKVRGEGSFDKAIEVIKHLNAIGYGRNPELVLNMVYNPGGAFIPPDQEAMEKEDKQKLLQDFGIEFNSL